jgi:hypothetical protein
VQPIERPLHEQTLARLNALGDEYDVTPTLSANQTMELVQALAYAREESVGL